MSDPILLDGDGLTPEAVVAIGHGAGVSLAPEGLERMQRTRAILEAEMAGDKPIYGVTTGLGPRVVERLPEDARTVMSLRTIRGRAHAVGAPLSTEIVRGAMAIRANSFLTGASGASPAPAQLLADCLNAKLTPVVGETASIGAADLLWGGSMALPLIGEGELETEHGVQPAAEALANAGLAPLTPGPREGLALCSHSSFIASIAALGIVETETLYETAQTAAALSLEGFRGNLSPIDPDVAALRPQPGQAEAAEGLRARLAGSALHQPGAARRLQDPLSLRNIAQIHGAMRAALDHARIATTAELSGASDNPVVLGNREEVLSTGGFLTPHLTIALGALNQAFVHLAAAQTSRMARLMTVRFSDLPRGLAPGGVDSAGLAPALKAAEALFSEIVHLAMPSPVYPGFSADGVEDIVAHSAVPGKALLAILERARRIVAIELMVAVQATELRELGPDLPPALADVLSETRRTVPPITEDRSLSVDIEGLVDRIRLGDFTMRSVIT